MIDRVCVRAMSIAALALALGCGDSEESEASPSVDPGDASAADGGPNTSSPRDANTPDPTEPASAPDAASRPDATSPVASEPEPEPEPEPDSPPDAGRDPSPVDANLPAPDDDAGTDPEDASIPEDDTPLYAPNQLLDFTFTLIPTDWDLIRSEGRSLNEVFSYCVDPAFDYTIVPANAVIAGREVTQIGFRKKGFIGSLSTTKPSLHLDIGEYAKDQRVFGTKTLVLNNSLQDASYTHTCMAYAMFTAAGVAAPRCTFARVTVNGADLGIYVHVEAIKKPFLARHFGDDSGSLYEGNGFTDFRADMLVHFEKKTNEQSPLAPEIEQLTEILSRPGDDILPAIEALVDMDAFMRFWASEVLIAHWDGYTGDLNNFYVYLHPTTGKLIFIPWGTDAAFEHVHPYLRKEPRPQSVYAWAQLPQRLYAIEASRERFRATLRALLNEPWDEAELLAEVDRIAALLGGRADASELEAQRTFIRNRRGELLAELDGPAPTWAVPARPPLMCQPERNSVVTGSFSTTWGDLSAYGLSANNVLNVVLDGAPRTFSGVFASAGFDGDGLPTLQVGAPLSDGRLVAARFMLAEVPSGPGEVALHGFETYGAVVRGRSESEYAVDGFISAGKIVFDRAAAASGAPLSGRFEGQLITLEPALAAQYGKP